MTEARPAGRGLPVEARPDARSRRAGAAAHGAPGILGSLTAPPVRDVARAKLGGREAGVWWHPREADRLASLASYKILDTLPELPYDSAARLAAVVCGAPLAMVTLVDEDRQWFKAVAGPLKFGTQTPRSDSFCSDAVALESLLVIEDTKRNPRYAQNRYVTEPPQIRAYAGMPLIGRDGLPLGTLCVLDTRPRRFTGAQLENLAALALNVVTHLELRRVDRLMGRDPARLLGDSLDPVRLRRAIEKGEFVSRYQPIVDMETGVPRAFEALVRWSHPELGEIPPALFLPAMERTGLMRSLGRWILADALDLARSLATDWRWAKTPKVAVNVSGTEFDAPGLATEIADSLHVRSVAPDALCVEVTESVPLETGQAATEIAELRRLGVGIALDDFGCGTATVGKIVDLPITAVKLDRSLATAIDSPRARAVVSSTLQMAADIGLELSGEGIETPSQRDALLDLGVTTGQGWLFARPLERSQIFAGGLSWGPAADSLTADAPGS